MFMITGTTPVAMVKSPRWVPVNPTDRLHASALPFATALGVDLTEIVLRHDETAHGLEVRLLEPDQEAGHRVIRITLEIGAPDADQDLQDSIALERGRHQETFPTGELGRGLELRPERELGHRLEHVRLLGKE